MRKKRRRHFIDESDLTEEGIFLRGVAVQWSHCLVTFQWRRRFPWVALCSNICAEDNVIKIRTRREEAWKLLKMIKPHFLFSTKQRGEGRRTWPVAQFSPLLWTTDDEKHKPYVVPPTAVCCGAWWSNCEAKLLGAVKQEFCCKRIITPRVAQERQRTRWCFMWVHFL